VVGDDPLGTAIITCLRGEGVDVAGVVVDRTAPTGLLLKERRTATSNLIRYYRTGSAGSLLAPEHVRAEDVDDAQLVLISGITAALSSTSAQAIWKAVELAHARAVPVCLDVNYRSQLWSPFDAGPVLRRLVAAADLVFATAAEAEIVLGSTIGEPGDAAIELAKLGSAAVVVKCGARGVVALAEGELRDIAARRVNAVDPVGAGDALLAGTIAEILNGADLHTALHTGVQVAALAVCVPGDWEGLPRRGELALLADGHDDVVR
jgi:2-dehydro-3-deoxygluconokinase